MESAIRKTHILCMICLLAFGMNIQLKAAEPITTTIAIVAAKAIVVTTTVATCTTIGYVGGFIVGHDANGNSPLPNGLTLAVSAIIGAAAGGALGPATASYLIPSAL
ncbi:hypothetical protein OAB57_00245 [Bacteriovoracaceae bacterium]|nr:hypothetical protein [Bacteriovoracaceae bacterium]